MGRPILDMACIGRGAVFCCEMCTVLKFGLSQLATQATGQSCFSCLGFCVAVSEAI